MARISISEAARRVGLTRQTLHKHIADGRLSVLRDGDSPEIDEAELFRVYGDAFTPGVAFDTAGLQDITPRLSAEIERLKQELTSSRQREIWFQQHVDRLAANFEQAQRLLTSMAPTPDMVAPTVETVLQPAQARWWRRRFRLFVLG